MLPKDEFRDSRMNRLKIFKDYKHPYNKVRFLDYTRPVDN